MADTKYGNYVVRHPVQTGGYGPEFIYTGETDYKSNFTTMFLRITEATLMEDYPHSHDFDMYLYFLALDPDDMDDLHADIEMGLGPEREIHKSPIPPASMSPPGWFTVRWSSSGWTSPSCSCTARWLRSTSRIPIELLKTRGDYRVLGTIKPAAMRSMRICANPQSRSGINASSPTSGIPLAMSPPPSSRTS
jgi:hypothetical protein